MSVFNRETFTRILSAIITLPILVYVLTTDDFLSLPVLIATVIISLFCLYEFYMMADRGEEGYPFIKAGLIFGLILNVLMYIFAYGKLLGLSGTIALYDARIITAYFMVFIATVLLLQLFTRPLKGAAYSLGVTLFGVFYIVLSLSHLILLKSLKDGPFYIIIAVAVVMLNDTGAYFGGSAFGKHKAGIAASPNKSWEGYFTGLLFSIIAFILTNQIFISFFGRELFSMIECVFLGILLSIMANIGDLIESAIKRDGGFKDSGRIIPGHGGMWDVFDATIFALPFFYYYLVFKGIP